MYRYHCKYCAGTVRPRVVERESFKHKNGFIILEDVAVGVCDHCEGVSGANTNGTSETKGAPSRRCRVRRCAGR
ncbi:MAG: YgiT-type zinc finger protein [Gammaproteobacteria bacterium]